MAKKEPTPGDGTPETAVEWEDGGKHVHVESGERYLRCNLSPEEFALKASELTQAIDQLSSLEDEAKAIKADLKSRQDAAAAEVSRLNNIVRNRYEMRYVGCEATLNFDTRKVVAVREDTGEVVEDRDMRLGERERQAELFPLQDVPFEPEAQPDGKSAAAAG